MLGDFNIDRVGDPLSEAFTSTGLTPAPQLEGLPRTIFDKPGAEHFYDQIAWFTQGQKQRPVLRLEAVAGGQVDFVDTLLGEQTHNDRSWHISDHSRSGWSSRSQRAICKAEGRIVREQQIYKVRAPAIRDGQEVR
ncbi:hypothetical protein ABIE67_009020 [Streptomyces sp. V4I8]|uniref:hypothetical protein n=1 Tax=Streptomyces sp. V4I8 TaxID=3156469 RepID=UPI0035198F4F